MSPMKLTSRTVSVLYLLALLWLVLFKTSLDIATVFDYQTKTLNLIPFAGYLQGGAKDAISNVVIFIPFGLLLGVNLKQANFRRKLACILSLSLAVEVIQFIFAIGRSDITDIITNVSGGLLGLLLYKAGSKYIDNEKLDWFLMVTIAALLILLFLLRTLVFKIRY